MFKSMSLFSSELAQLVKSVQRDDIILIKNLESMKGIDMLSITCKLIQ